MVSNQGNSVRLTENGKKLYSCALLLGDWLFFFFFVVVSSDFRSAAAAHAFKLKLKISLCLIKCCFHNLYGLHSFRNICLMYLVLFCLSLIFLCVFYPPLRYDEQ